MPRKVEDTQGPQDWDKAVSAAHLRLLGATQEDAGDAVGVSRDTVSRWEGCLWWPDAVKEASDRWLSGLEAKARVVLQSGMDATIALKVLERRVRELSPAATNINLTADIPDRVLIEYVDPVPDEESED